MSASWRFGTPALGEGSYSILWGGQNRPIGYSSQQLDPVILRLSPCLKAVAAVYLPYKATKKIAMGSPLTMFHTVETLLNSYYIQHFSLGHLTEYEVFLLPSPHLTITHATYSCYPTSFSR